MIKIGETYRHRSNPSVGFAKVVQVLKPGEFPNTKTYTIYKCEWTVGDNDVIGLIKYFRASDLQKDKPK